MGIEFCKIRKRQHSIVLIRELNDLSRNFPLVECIATLFGNCSQTSRELGHFEDLAMARGSAIDQEDACGIRSLAQFFFGALPLARDNLGYRETLFGIFDGRREKPADRKLSIFLMQLVPARNSSRYRYRIHPGSRYVIEIPASEKINSGLGSSPTASIQTDGLFVLLHINESEHIATDARHDGLDHIQNGGCCDGRVYRISTVFQKAQSCC